MQSGTFIAFEGMDGSGTTTQSQQLVQAIKNAGMVAHWTCEPTNGPIGHLIRQAIRRQITLPNDKTYSTPTLAALFAADRLYHLDAEILPNLLTGHHVITDRYDLSSLAYQGEDPNDIPWIQSLNSKALRPQFTFYLKLDPQIAMQRIIKRADPQDIYEQKSYLITLASRYESLIQDLISKDKENIFILDAALHINTIHEKIINIVNQHHMTKIPLNPIT